ncbi:MAG: zf-HC2 domain-containing protein [Deltaproteobacteria bacterium]|nr:zf-HC2 domain-containing protein [Deltaproteobacteria bacterium]
MMEILGAWLDGEIGARESEAIRFHLESCASCRAAKLRLERVEESLSAAVKAQASDVSWPQFWSGVERRIREESERRERLWSWLRPGSYLRRLAWAVPLAVVCLLVILLAEQYFFRWRLGPNLSSVAAVESIDGHGFNLALFGEDETNTTLIWLFLDEEEDEPSAEVPVADTTF